jgi:hypothetical protein
VEVAGGSGCSMPASISAADHCSAAQSARRRLALIRLAPISYLCAC